ncbi:MAG: hypothetical protein OEZ34_12065 [Spirochaetia bacterium]|nr:hypothetical protein [Spirochaetia bacterium]
MKLFISGLLLASFIFSPIFAQSPAGLIKQKKATESNAEYKNRMRKSYLYLSGGNINNTSLNQIFEYPSLSTLVVKSTRVDSGGVNTIANHPGISFLSLERSSVNNGSAHALSRMPALHMLDLSYTAINDQALNIMKNKNFSYLNLTGTRISNKSPAIIVQNFQEIKRLDMMNTEISDDSIAMLIGRKDEKDFVQEIAKNPKIATAFFSKHKKRHRLENRGLKKLIDLNLAGTKITDRGLAILSLMRGLQLLDLSVTSITPDGFKFLYRLKNIEVLSLSGTSFSDSEIAILMKLKDLKILSIENTAVSDRGLRRLVKHPSLYSIYLNGSLVTQQGIDKFLDKRPTCKLHHATLKVSIDKQGKK